MQYIRNYTFYPTRPTITTQTYRLTILLLSPAQHKNKRQPDGNTRNV